MKDRLKIIGVLLILAVLVGGLWVVNATDNREVSVVGAGRIGDPIPGATIPSLSDFGFAVSDDRGTFVCSMAGPETGGFAGFRVMTVEGPVTPGSLQVRGREIRFSGKATVVLIPGLGGASQTVLDGVDYAVIARTGKENHARMILQIPDFTGPLGGDTGGILAQGEIRKMGQD
jgi:hypothetical protein